MLQSSLTARRFLIRVPQWHPHAKAIARITPIADDTVLRVPDGRTPEIRVGSPAWYTWLETIFAFATAEGSVTACKERSRGGW